MERILVLIRHAKSDWSQPVSDEQRPLASRGRRQAPAVGQWLTHNLYRPLELVLMSPATRARQTWELVDAELSPSALQVRSEPGVYTFAGAALRAVIAEIDERVSTAAVVGHNPALEDLVGDLVGSGQRIRTASVAVLGLQRWSAATGQLLALGRPADGMDRMAITG